MTDKFARIFLITQGVNRQHIQIALSLLALILFVLAAGAPSDGGINPHMIIRLLPIR